MRAQEMQRYDVMVNKDQLLTTAEVIADELPSGAKNEMRRVLHYFIRHGDYNSMIMLLQTPPPYYGRQAKERWEGVRDVLAKRKNLLQSHSPAEIAFVLGWAARILR